jgi:hypothetical protein
VPQELNLKDRQDVGSKGRDTNWAEIDEVLWKIMSRCQCQVHGACLDARLPPTLLSTQLQKKKSKMCSVVQKTLPTELQHHPPVESTELLLILILCI